jgi:hypothetical protein
VFSPAIIAAKKIPASPISGRIEGLAVGTSLFAATAGDDVVLLIGQPQRLDCLVTARLPDC